MPDRDDIDRIVELAALDIEPDTLPVLRNQIRQILEYISQLEAFADEPVTPDGPDVAAPQPLRPDTVRPASVAPTPGVNAPEFRDGLFVVPKLDALDPE